MHTSMQKLKRKFIPVQAPKFDAVVLMPKGTFLEVVKEMCGLPTSGNRWHTLLSHTLREIGFKPNRFYPDVWIRGCKDGYNYIGTHTDDVLVVAVDPTSIFEKLKVTYKIKAFGPPVVHLGCDYARVKKGDETCWIMGYYTYITECLGKVYALLKVSTLRKEKLPCSPGDHPE